jgi:hypothetical protein
MSEPTASPDLLVDLPHWARVAFAARCARHVSLLLATSWSEATASRRQAFDQAVGLAESSAISARAEAALEQASIKAAQAAGAALRALYGFTSGEPLPGSGGAATTAAGVLRAAEQAAEAARAVPAASIDKALAAYRFAREAASGSPHARAFFEAMEEDLGRLRRMARIEHWDDQTPIPSGLFR